MHKSAASQSTHPFPPPPLRAAGALALAMALLAASPSRQTPPTPAPVPTITPLPTASASPTPLPSITPIPTLSPLPTPAPVPTPAPLPTPIVLPPNAPPRIQAVAISDTAPHSGETVSGVVVTSSNVAAVELRMAAYAVRLKRAAVGIWHLSYTLPDIPFWARRHYSAQVVALNTNGVQAARQIDFSLR